MREAIQHAPARQPNERNGEERNGELLEAHAGPVSTRRAEFDALYGADPDPWRMETSSYEAAKYDATLAALPRERYARGLEVGCSIGVLSVRLAERCERLTAVDVSEAALRRARARPTAERIEWRRAEVPDEWPGGPRDLIVLSEVLYFLNPIEVREVARLAARDLDPQGTLMVVNWTGECDRALTGDAAAELFLGACEPFGIARVHHERQPLYRIDVLARS